MNRNTGCLDLPAGKIRELARKTDDTGREHAFIVCNGEIEGEFVGDEDSLEFETDCDDAVIVFHTHPNDTLRPSEQDMRVLDKDSVGLMCVGDTNGQYTCHKDGFACAADVDELESPSGGATAGTMALAEEPSCEWYK